MKRQALLAFFCFVTSSLALAGQSFLPGGFCPLTLDYTHYSLCYDSDHRQASWVKYELTQELISGKQKRTNNYRPDHSLKDPVLETDYKGSGFDRGHLLPAADMKLDYQAMSETFFMTNMSPQRPGFNRRIWASIESRVRDLVREHGVAHVVTAGHLTVGLDRLKTDVSIPEVYYKALYFPKAEIMKAFLIENRDYKNADVEDFLVTVDEVEQLTGFDFFSELPDPLEAQLESTLRF